MTASTELSLQRNPNAWRSVTGSAMCETSGFALMEDQNVHQMSHALWALWSREGTIPMATIFGRRWSIFHDFSVDIKYKNKKQVL